MPTTTLGPHRRGVASNALKTWLACGFAAIGVAAVGWQAWPMVRPKPKADRPKLVAATPTDETGNVIETNYRPAGNATQREAVLADLNDTVRTKAQSLPAAQLKGPAEGLGVSTRSVLTMMMDVSDESISEMIASMGGITKNDEGELRDNSMLVKFIKGMFAEGELDLDRMVVRPKPDDKPAEGTSGPARVSRDASERQRAAADGPAENKRVSAIRLVGPYDGLEAIAEKQRPIEVRVPYKPKGAQGERVLALDLLYNPGSRTWQLAEMRFQQFMTEDQG